MPSEIHNTNDQTCDICEGVCDGGFLGWTKLRESGPPDKYPRGVQMPVELEELIYVPCGGTSIQYSREEEDLVLNPCRVGG
ncbi:hypothetical protein ACFX10_007491 [Malus domestica]